ncbi:respiratory nitrate reductase subunit gamma [Nocardia mexicana]|uniref:Nitrate reductase-like protein NarX n=1 Tax=Nocardia mexicana TaxID=279262 RepID=A0A370HER0_9NOCA|nr:respiratory nitrate reductase subunit gamma [Nocardia mexicana]RDI55190.1 nitrate reductase gamma subunit [Nocardia mexicana]
MTTHLAAPATETLSALDILLWAAVPYLSIATFVVGHVWRYRYDKFGWTTRSSQLYENRLLRLGSPLFHYGILLVVLGHVGGLLIPKTWTEAVGISENAYHAIAVGLGAVAGAATLTGAAILVYRRRTVGPVFSATTRNDKIMYVLLIGTIVLGLGTTVLGNLTGHPHDYRETVSPWFRSIFTFQPDPALMTLAPIGFQLHVLAAWALFAFWPFSRLVHVFSFPLGYLARPYIVYRSRDTGLGTHAPRRGWEPTGSTPDTR